jgi:hypothetical protein
MRWESGSGHHAGDQMEKVPKDPRGEEGRGRGWMGRGGEGGEDLFLISVYDKAESTSIADEAVCRLFVNVGAHDQER